MDWWTVIGWTLIFFAAAFAHFRTTVVGALVPKVGDFKVSLVNQVIYNLWPTIPALFGIWAVLA